jgi:uncharacterized protein GlcG (DUF336 family)
MRGTERLRGWVGERDCRYCLGAAVSLAAAAAVAYGLTHDDVVTALGGLLFVSPAILFAGIGLTGSSGHRRSDGSGSA